MYRLLLLIVVLILYGSLFPWNFQFAGGSSHPVLTLVHSWPNHWDLFTARDATTNMMLYFPLGTAAFLAIARRHATASAMAGSFVIGLTLAFAIELLQIYVPTRISSLFDVVCDLAGVAVGTAFALFFRSRIESRPGSDRGKSVSSAILLLGCWATCHLYPFFPNFNLYRLKSEFAFLFHPCDTQYCCCTVGFYLAGIGIALGEWFVVTSLLQAIFGRMRSRWIVAALCLRIMLRPMVITRPLGPDEVIGALLALFLWLILPETARWRVSFFMLAAVVFVRELGPFHFSAVPTGFSWIPFADVFAAQRQGETIFLFQKVFDYGSLIWLLCAARRSQVQAGLLIASYITVLEAIQMYSQGHRPTTTDPILILLITIGLRFANSDGSHRMAGQHPAAVQ